MKLRAHYSGFTLIEVMIVVAIVAILASVAYPSYQEHIIKSRRTAAASCILEQVQFMERFFTTNMRYDQTTAGTAVALPALSCMNELDNFYTIGFAATPTASVYSIQAVPKGGQTKDTRCMTLTIDQRGNKQKSGSAANVAECW